MWVAKPNLNNNNGLKEFENVKDAVGVLRRVHWH